MSTADWAWSQQSIWSQTANKLRSSLSRWRAVALALTITAAVLATLGTQVATVSSPTGKGLLLAAAIAAGLVPLIRPLYGRKAVEEWTRARSASETLKEQVYTYLAGVSPYRGTDRDQLLRSEADATLKNVDDLQPRAHGIQPKYRSLPEVRDVGEYVTIRVNGQIQGSGLLTWCESRCDVPA